MAGCSPAHGTLPASLCIALLLTGHNELPAAAVTALWVLTLTFCTPLRCRIPEDSTTEGLLGAGPRAEDTLDLQALKKESTFHPLPRATNNLLSMAATPQAPPMALQTAAGATEAVGVQRGMVQGVTHAHLLATTGPQIRVMKAGRAGQASSMSAVGPGIAAGIRLGSERGRGRGILAAIWGRATAVGTMNMPLPAASMKATVGVQGTQAGAGASMNKTPTVLSVAAALVAAGDRDTTRATTPLPRQLQVTAAPKITGAVMATAGAQGTPKAAAAAAGRVQGSMQGMVGIKAAATETAAAGLLGGKAQGPVGKDQAVTAVVTVVAGRPAECSLACMLEASQPSTARHMTVSFAAIYTVRIAIRTLCMVAWLC